MSVQILSVVGALTCLGLIFEMVRRRNLREKYAVLWLGVGAFILVVGLFPGVFVAASDLIGVQVPANLLFFLASIFLLLVSVQQSTELGRLEERTRVLAEESGQLRLEIDVLRRVVHEAGATTAEADPDKPPDVDLDRRTYE